MDTCKNLQILYLESNNLTKIENLDSLVNLRILHLDNNNIKKLENLENMVNLKQFSIKNNQIHLLENLEYCTSLEELNISKQRIGENSFLFDPNSICIISQTLISLECEKNNVEKIESFEFFGALNYLNIKGNRIHAIEV